MYFIKRGLKYINNKKVKSILIAIIFFVIANFVLAGLSVNQATLKSSERTRIEIGADLSYTLDMYKMKNAMQSGLIAFDGDITELQGYPTYGQFQKLISSDLVESYDSSLSYQAITPDGIIPYEISETSSSGNSNNKFSFEGIEGDLDAKFISRPISTDFEDEVNTLVDGSYPTQAQIDNGEPVILISEDLAELNNYNVGNVINLNLLIEDYEDIEKAYKIIGIFTTTEEVDDRVASFLPSSMLPQNRIYMPFNILNTLGLSSDDQANLELNSNRISLIDPLYIEEYKEWAATQVDLSEDSYAMLDANDTLYNSLIAPIEGLSSVSTIIVITVSIAGALIIGLITALTINERKSEIGILLAVGESKVKIILQFVFEIIVIAMIAFSFSIVSGAKVGTLISDVVLNNQEEPQDNFSNGKNRKGGFDVISSPNRKATNIEVSDVELDIKLDNKSILFAGFIGIFISIISVLIPSMYVMRFNPKQILSNNN